MPDKDEGEGRAYEWISALYQVGIAFDTVATLNESSAYRLPIGIDEHDINAVICQVDGQITGDRGLAYAALLRSDQNAYEHYLK